MHDGLQDQRQWLMRSTALHLATLWLPRKGNALTYNTIISEVLCSKLTQIAVSASTCYWMTNSDRQESTDWERSWSWTSKIVGMTLDNILQHWPPITILYNTVETFRFQGSTISYDLKWVSNVDSGHQEGQWENVFHAPIQKVQPASGDPDPVLPLNCPVCTSIIVWFGWATKLEQTTMGSQDCRGNHWWQPALHSDLKHLQSTNRAENITADPSQRKHNIFQFSPLVGNTEHCMATQLHTRSV